MKAAFDSLLSVPDDAHLGVPINERFKAQFQILVNIFLNFTAK
jgi:hypothetical protein